LSRRIRFACGSCSPCSARCWRRSAGRSGVRPDQYAYAGPDGRSHLLLLNLSNVTNRIRVVAHRDGARARTRLVAVPPLGARLLDVGTLAPAAPGLMPLALRLEGNAWFNLYLVGAGPRDLAGPLSLMHVK